MPYRKQVELNHQIIQSGLIEEDFLEIFDLIQEFYSTDDFAAWITNKNFEHTIYKNEIKEGKYLRDWQYTFEKKSFLWGKLELDTKKIPEHLRSQLLKMNSIFYGTEQLVGIEKICIHSVLTDFHCTVVSNALYQGLLVGSLWEIYNLPLLLKIYEKKQDPLRYWRKTRRE